MLIKTKELDNCRYCGFPIEIHEYIGLEGAWYTEHLCPEFGFFVERTVPPIDVWEGEGGYAI